MSFAAQPYELFADDLLTGLTGGTSREEHRFVGADERYSLATPGAMFSTVKVFGQRNEAVIVFEGGIDYDYDPGDGVIRWRANGRLPDDRSYFYINYYVADTPRRLTDRNPGSVTTTLAEAFAREFAVLHKQMEQIYQSAFVDSASGSSLDHIAALLALTRKDAKFASGEVLLKRSTPADGDITVPAGALVSTADGRNFETTDKRTLRKGQLSVVAPIRAQVEGTAGRVDKGLISNINRPIFGIETATNEAPTFFVTTKETDDELRRRIWGTLERAGKSTANAIKFSLIQDIPGINEANVQVTESREVPGKVEVKFGLGGTVDPDLVRRIEETIFNARPAGVRVTHNLPTRSGAPTQPSTITRTEAIELFRRKGQPVETLHIPAEVLGTIPEGLLPLEIEVLLRLYEPNLSPAQKESIEGEVRTAIVQFIDALPMGADLIYSKLLGRIVDSKAVSDAVLLVRVVPPDAEPTEVFRQNISTDGRKASVSPYSIFVGLMEEPVALDVLVQLQPIQPKDTLEEAPQLTPPDAPKITLALQQAVENAVRDLLEQGDDVLTHAALEDAVRRAVGSTDRSLKLVDSHAVVLNAEYEATGRLLYDTDRVAVEENQLFTIHSIDVRMPGDLDG
jgi:uncharacterized phage protein gp47/JayE